MSTSPTVLVIGAGELGLAVLQSLVAHPSRGGSQISVLLRSSTITSTDPSKKERNHKLRTMGLSFESGDIEADNIDQLSIVFERFDVVIGCSGMEGSSGVQLKISQAAINAGVKRYIPWQFGVDYDILGRESSQDLFDEQLDVRAALRTQDKCGWTIISTGIFMSFLFEDFFGVVSQDRKTVRALGSWNNAVTCTTVGDIGRMTAHIVYTCKDIEDEVVFIAGDTITYVELADAIEKHQGFSIEREEWTVAYLKNELEKDSGNGIKKYRVVFAEGRGVAWEMPKTLNSKMDIKLQTVKEWM